MTDVLIGALEVVTATACIAWFWIAWRGGGGAG
jgi:hypothetical protein